MKITPGLRLRSMKKAQIITFDFSTSLIVFVIFLVVFLGLFFLSQTSEKKPEFETEYVYANLENNLKFSLAERDFFTDYRVNRTRLENFTLALGSDSSDSIDSYVIGTIGGAHGIGLDEAGYDVCLYFTDNDKSILTILPGSPAIKVLGQLGKTGNSCNQEMIVLGNDPCDLYNQAVSVFKPVLFDENDYHENRILQMNMIICKI